MPAPRAASAFLREALAFAPSYVDQMLGSGRRSDLVRLAGPLYIADTATHDRLHHAVTSNITCVDLMLQRMGFPQRPQAASWRLLLSGAAIGTIGGLIGLGGAEFRLPLLLTIFSFVALEAVILNKAISLAVVLSALVFRRSTIPFGDVLAQWPIIVNLLTGSLAGAWLGADLAARVSTTTIYA